VVRHAGSPKAKSIKGKAGGSAPSGAPAGPFRARRIALADGVGLSLRANGTIDRIDATGDVTGSWGPTDSDWASHAIRFGLRPQQETVAPTGGPTLIASRPADR
jgi:hypothetical protein